MLKVEQHLNEIQQIVLDSGDMEAAETYIAAHGIDIDELIHAAMEFFAGRKYIQRLGEAAQPIAHEVAMPSFIIGVMVGLKHGVSEVPEELDLESL